ncbi:MAG: hypothetical protein ACJAVK_002142 [Akkermansiaceae bacterium]
MGRIRHRKVVWRHFLIASLRDGCFGKERRGGDFLEERNACNFASPIWFYRQSLPNNAMKNSTLIPLFLVTAAAAFGLGWTSRPDTVKEDEAGLSARGESSRTSRLVGLGRSGRGGPGADGPEGEFLARYLVDGEIAAVDMKAAIEEIANMNDPLLKQKIFSLLLENLTIDNAKEAFLALQENRGGGRFGRGNDDQLRLLANAWGRIDGPGAIASLKEIAAERGEEGDDRGRGRGGRGPNEMSSVLAGWATVDGAGASAYVNGIEDEREQRGAAYGVLQGMLVNGVDEAMSFIGSLPASEDGDRSKGMYMAMVTGEMLEQGLDQAQNWVDTVKDPELRTGALARVTMEMMQDDRAGAAEWIAKYGDEDAAAPAVSRLADSWSREDPKAVMEWAENLSGKSKSEAYQEAMESWAREDAVAAGEYLKGMQESPERDAAVEGYATRVSRENPVTAMEWAETIVDQGTRQETMVDVARDWLRNDKTAAEEWIQASGLPEEVVQSINEPRRDFGRGGPRGR